MLDAIDLTPREAELRHEVRKWIAAHSPYALIGQTSDDVRLHGTDEQQQTLAAWTDAAAEQGLVCSGWPREFGGRDLNQREIAILTVEFALARLPRPTRGAGESLVGPAVIAHGTDEQRARILPRIVSGQDLYCQGFSEPDAGSDLAGVRTVGTVDGDELVITGQKIWTSGAHRANHIFLLCRTDPDAAKHRGISYVIVPMRRDDGEPNGIEIRPIKQITGAERFFETFIDEARAPLVNVVGGINEGWRTAMTTLGNERAGRAASQYLDAEREYRALLDHVGGAGRSATPSVDRDHLAELYVGLEILRFNTLRSLSAGADPAIGGLASIHKLQWSEYVQRFTEVAVALSGPAALAHDGERSPATRWGHDLLHNRCHTIWGGTSEVQRNIVAERVLGLPKEPR